MPLSGIVPLKVIDLEFSHISGNHRGFRIGIQKHQPGHLARVLAGVCFCLTGHTALQPSVLRSILSGFLRQRPAAVKNQPFPGQPQGIT